MADDLSHCLIVNPLGCQQRDGGVPEVMEAASSQLGLFEQGVKIAEAESL